MVKKILFGVVLVVALAACSDDSTAEARPGLTGIEVSSGTLTPAFSPGITRYAITVPGSTTELSLTPTRTAPGVTVTATGATPTAGSVFTVRLSDGDNLVTFAVTAPDRPAVTYTVTITRPSTVVASRDGAAPSTTTPATSATSTAPTTSAAVAAPTTAAPTTVPPAAEVAPPTTAPPTTAPPTTAPPTTAPPTTAPPTTAPPTTAPPTTTIPVQTSAPTDITVDAGQTATFSTTASNGTSPYTYQWQVSTGGAYTNVSSGTGGTTATYTTASLTTGNSGNTYRVIVTDSAGVPTSVTSGAATLTVNAALSTSTPSNTTVDAGQTATFSTTASNGTAPYTYQWQVSTGGAYTNVSSGTGSTTATYTTSSLTTGNSGNTYRVIVTDSAAVPTSVTSGAATLTVNAALSVSTPTDITVDAGQTATFSVGASNGTSPYTYQWQVSTGGAYTNVSSGTGGTTGTYTTSSLTTGSSGNTYRVIVTDSAAVPTSVTSSAATLTVNAALSVSTPTDITVDAGQTATFSVGASNGTSPYTYQWQVSTGGAYTNVSSGTGGTTGTYTTASLTTGNSGNTYRVIVTDSAAVPTSVTSGAATLTVNAALSTSTPSTTTVDAGQTATFSTTASNGTAPYTYQWQVSTGGAYTNVSSGTGGTTATYTTASLTTGNSGNTYRVIVTDSAAVPTSVTSSAATLTVNAALSVSTPSSQTISLSVSNTATFSVIASNGTSPYTYQWQVNSQGLSSFVNVSSGTGGTTATYTTGTLTISGNNGDLYRVIVTDSAGVPVSVTSGSASLIVTT